MSKHMEILREQIKRHEGLRLEVYLDSLGNPTVGYGHHLIRGSPITQQIADLLLDMDLQIIVKEFRKLPFSFRRQLNPSRARVIANMIFNMGLPRVFQFKKMIKAIEIRDFEKASHEMLDSRWARQVGQRAIELALIMREGKEQNGSQTKRIESDFSNSSSPAGMPKKYSCTKP